MLVEQRLAPSDRPMSQAAQELVKEGRSRFETVDCFEFVPSNYEMVWSLLDALPRGRFCEWGSGLGIVTGLAEILGFDAHGIEIDAELALAARRLLADVGLSSQIETGDFLTIQFEADIYFVYCWWSKVRDTESRFSAVAPADAKLLVYHGQSDIRCKVRGEERPTTVTGL